MNKMFSNSSPYHYNYGGLPSEIVNLTYEELIEFQTKLISNLNQQYSHWTGYVYHFTHIENAVQILKSMSILSIQI